MAGAALPKLNAGKVVGRQPHARGYWRIHDHALFPSLRNTKLLFLDGEFVEMEPLNKPLLTLIPPAMFGPPEKVWVDKVESEKPGLILSDHGKGKLAYVPWDVGGLYYRHSSAGHAGLMSDLIDHLLPQGRQLKTSAHPLVEMTLMEQPDKKRTQVHLVNLSGHSDTAYFAPIPMRDITIELAQEFRRARAVSSGKSLRVIRSGRYGRITVPQLNGYEVVIFE